jgi:hypothetical protein
MVKIKDIVFVTKKWGDPGYWTKVNIIEAWAFMTKIAIFFPVLILG